MRDSYFIFNFLLTNWFGTKNSGSFTWDDSSCMSLLNLYFYYWWRLKVDKVEKDFTTFFFLLVYSSQVLWISLLLLSSLLKLFWISCIVFERVSLVPGRLVAILLGAILAKILLEYGFDGEGIYDKFDCIVE